MQSKEKIIWLLLPILCSWFSPSVSASRDTEQQTFAYANGIGRITWTLPKDLETVIAVPHFTAGPRIKCASKRYECEIEVGPRDISITNEARLGQLEAAVNPFLKQATESNFKPLAHGKDKRVIYTTLHDNRPSTPFRYLTVGYAHKGPAVIKFTALTNDAVDTIAILSLVDEAKAIDALEMWALRFGDYKAACEDRFPAYKAANEKAFQASPFATVDVAGFYMRSDPSLTRDDIDKTLKTIRASFAESFDRDPKAKRQAFCEGFPRWIVEAATGLPEK